MSALGRWAARDEARPVETTCAEHGVELDEHRRCAECRAAAIAALKEATR